MQARYLFKDVHYILTIFFFLTHILIYVLAFSLVTGKNGVYSNLANNVREAFEECELVRVNCQGLNKSDYRKIGAKLRV